MSPMMKERLVEISSPLGEDVLLFRAMTGVEQLGGLFEFELDLLTEKVDLKLGDLLGQPVTVRLSLPDDKKRFFNGHVTRLSLVGRQGEHSWFRATMRPWLWFLTRTADCRIFQEMSVPDIVKKIFDDLGFSDYKFSLNGSYTAWTYCVQYRETDFNFVSRLMEQEGIYYYFTHEDGKHNLIVTDSYNGHEKIAGYEEIPYFPPQENVVRETEFISDWFLSQEIQPGAYSLTDYDFEKPKVSLAVRTSNPLKSAQASHEIYDQPGEYLVEDEGKTYSKTRLEELQARFEQVRGVCNARGMRCGGLFKLTGYPREDQNRECLVVSAVHDLQVAEYASAAGGEREEPPSYSCTFTAMDGKQQFRAPRVTPKPIVQGPQTAVVVGKSGEEIWTDKYGRVKVQFHWDREGKQDENSSCWIRVAQVWAGKTWGGIHIPRIGQEVIVDFLEGDPDCPIITGCVYNADQMPPYTLPDNQTQSGIKSRSSKEGSGDNFNEFRFEDRKGNEEVYLHAERDYNQIVENDRREDTGRDRSLHVGHDKSETVDNNKSIVVGVDHDEKVGSSMTVNIGTLLTETVGINYSETVGAAMELTIGAAFTETVGLAKVQSIGADKSETIKNDKKISIGNDRSETIAGQSTISIEKDRKETVNGKYELTVDKDKAETVNGASSDKVEKEYQLEAKTVTVSGKDEVVIKSGSASITLKSNGDITIKGNNINVKGDGDIVLKGSKVAAN
jgi:type VI secretion system secreted protein VgrG